MRFGAEQMVRVLHFKKLLKAVPMDSKPYHELDQAGVDQEQRRSRASTAVLVALGILGGIGIGFLAMSLANGDMAWQIGRAHV